VTSHLYSALHCTALHREANLKIPHLVIRFYEDHMDWGEEE